MSNAQSKSLAAHRLDGGTRSLGCDNCPLFNPCGGQTRVGGGWACFSGCQGCDQETCDLVCLGKPREFAEAFREVGGFGHQDIGSLRTPTGVLPRYIPVVQHPYETGRRKLLQAPWVALPLSSLLRHCDGEVNIIANSEDDLRERFKLGKDTRVVLLGTGPDEPIEKYWVHRRLQRLHKSLSDLGFVAAIAPNYSLFLDDPRPHHLYNRKRGLICAYELSVQGVPVVPYLHGVCPQDYDYWCTFLLSHPEVTYVAKEFQTGLSRPERGEISLDEIARLQDKIKRPLHLIAVGAAQYRGRFTEKFDGWTIIDSMPFMKAISRRKARLGSYRVHWDVINRRWIDGLLGHDIQVYGGWIASPFVPSPVRKPGSRSSRRQLQQQKVLSLGVTRTFSGG